jgi:hypothetical protein
MAAWGGLPACTEMAGRNGFQAAEGMTTCYHIHKNSPINTSNTVFPNAFAMNRHCPALQYGQRWHKIFLLSTGNEMPRKIDPRKKGGSFSWQKTIPQPDF